jgi:peptidoglycan/xylan/chitin deacetylase (PgdA/CDA1 family)
MSSSALNMIKRTVAPGLHQLSLISGISRYKTFGSPAARVIMFHGVGGPDCPADIFESQMRYLKANFNVVSLQEALTIFGDPVRNFSTEIVLTFDDGLQNNYTIAYPILLRYELPATFFVCPGLIESRTWQWAHEIEQRLMGAKPDSLNIICDKLGIGERGKKANSGSDVTEKIIELMKTMESDRRISAEHFIRSLTHNFEMGKSQHDLYDTMSWDELQSLDSELITVGSHTVHHQMLTRVSHEEMHYQIQESKQWLERKLSRPVEYFCYPNGDYDASIAHVVAQNYKAALTTVAGYFNKGDDVYQISRIPAADKVSLFAWRMFRP